MILRQGKYQGVVKIKDDVFIEVFEVGDLTLSIVTILCGWFHFFLGDGFSLGGVAPPWGRACLPKKSLSPPTEGSHHPQRVVNNFKNLHKSVKSYFDSSSVFVEYFGLNII